MCGPAAPASARKLPGSHPRAPPPDLQNEELWGGAQQTLLRILKLGKAEDRGPEVTGPPASVPRAPENSWGAVGPAEGHQRVRRYPWEGLSRGLISGPEHVAKLEVTRLCLRTPVNHSCPPFPGMRRLFVTPAVR